MLYRLTIRTTEVMTIERDNVKEARECAQSIEYERSKHHRHGEATKVAVRKVKPRT